MPAAVKSMIEKISCPAYKFSETDCIPDSDRSWENFRQEVIVDLEWLYERSENHESVATFAKILYLEHQTEEITKLRNIFSMFITMVQLEKAV